MTYTFQLEATLQQVESTRAENGKLQEEITGLREQGHIHHSTLRYYIVCVQ